MKGGARGEQQREDNPAMSDHFLIFGHRGSPKRFPENTLASFEEALRAGADGFETDLRLLSDKTAILFHDDEVGDRALESLSPADLSGKFQRVRDLAQFAGRTTMVLEVKRSKWEDILLSEISEWQNIIVASFDHGTIAELARRAVAFPLGLTIFGHIVDLPAYAKRLGASWVFPNYRYVDADLVSALHAADIRVVPWTPNRERDWSLLRDAGCDGVITDYPAEAVEWRGRKV
jgi:glycerophosphoryl diester phosphodiesterase